MNNFFFVFSAYVRSCSLAKINVGSCSNLLTSWGNGAPMSRCLDCKLSDESRLEHTWQPWKRNQVVPSGSFLGIRPISNCISNRKTSGKVVHKLTKDKWKSILYGFWKPAKVPWRTVFAFCWHSSWTKEAMLAAELLPTIMIFKVPSRGRFWEHSYKIHTDTVHVLFCSSILPINSDPECSTSPNPLYSRFDSCFPALLELCWISSCSVFLFSPSVAFLSKLS